MGLGVVVAVAQRNTNTTLCCFISGNDIHPLRVRGDSVIAHL